MFSAVKALLSEKIGDDAFELSPPEISGRGHLSTNAAFLFSSKGNISPIDAAEELKKHLNEKAPKGFFEKIEIAGPGFINMWFTPKAIQKEFKKIADAGVSWGKPNKKPKGKIIVEYSQPNIAKQMHIGHLRSTIIGDSLANIYDFYGYDVLRWNYLGDWGTQFGKLITAYKLWGDKSKIESNPIEELNNLYVKFHRELKENPELEEKGREEFKKLEDGDKENRKLWEWFRRESLKDLENVYNLLGIKFDIWKGESFYEKDLKPLIDEFLKSGIARESEGAIIIPLDKFNLPPGLIRKSDGATLYLTRDIANLKYRISKYKPKEILYVVDNGQSLHFQQLFAIADILGLDKSIPAHIKFGLVLSEDIKKLSTREGRHISLLKVVEEAINRARNIIEAKQPDLSDADKDEIAKTVGVGAIKYNDLSQNRVSDITFNWDKMLSLSGNSGPYIQYTYARLKSILRKAGGLPSYKLGSIENEADLALILKLAEFPGIIESVIENNYPNYIAGYIYDLAKMASNFYEKEPVLKSEPEIRNTRLNLINATANVLRTGLNLLGIGVIERM